MKKLNMILEKKFDPNQTKDNYHLNVLHQNLSKHYNRFNLDEKTIDSIQHYSSDSSHINGHLWNNYKNKVKSMNTVPDYDVKKIQNTIENLDSAMKSHKTPHELTLWSGSKHDPRDWMDKNSIVHHPAYMSTSLVSNKSAQFASYNPKIIDKGNFLGNKHEIRNIYKIHVPEGHPGMYIGHISSLSSEREFLLPRGTNLRHIKTEYHSPDRGQYGKIHTKVHHMEVVP